MQLYLKLNGEFVPITISNDNDLALTYSYDGLNSPVEYISEFTYEVKVPKTKDNNISLGHVGIDSIVTESWFDPSTKIEYMLISKNSELISNGNAYLNHVDDEYYYIQLLGSLNDVFTKLLNSGWDKNKINPNSEQYNKDYYLMPEYLNWDGTGYNTKRIFNNKTVYGGWVVDSINKKFDFNYLKQNYNKLFLEYNRISNEQAYIGNIIQFAPTNQGLYKEFDSTRWYTRVSGINKLVNVFRGLNNDTNKDPFPTTDKGVNEIQVGEYRSYYQKPCIFVQRLFEWFQEECPRITGDRVVNADGTINYKGNGYKLILDRGWYNESNGYINTLMYTLPSLYNNNLNAINKEEIIWDGKLVQNLPLWVNFNQETNKVNGLNNVSAKYFAAINNVDKIYSINTSLKLGIEFLNGGKTEQYKSIIYNNVNPIILTQRLLKDSDNTEVAVKRTLCVPLRMGTASGDETLETAIPADMLSLWRTVFDDVIGIQYNNYSNNSTSPKIWSLSKDTIEVGITVNSGEQLKYELSLSFYNDITIFRNHGSSPYEASNGDFRTGKLDRCYLQRGGCRIVSTYLDIKREYTDSNRSFQSLTLEKLFKNINPFSILLKFAKMLNMVWVVNDTEKVITLYDRDTHFSKCITGEFYNKYGIEKRNSGLAGVLDLTRYVDYSKGYEINIPSWIDKYIELNYSDKADTDFMKSYYDKYNRTYGGKTIITQNNKNNDTYKLLCNNENDTINPSLMSSEMVISAYSIINNIQPFNISPYTPQIDNKKDGKTADIWNNFYFRLKNGTYNPEFNKGYRAGYVYITDDLFTEMDTNNYAWHGDTGDNAIKCYIRPRYGSGTVDANIKSIHFAPTQEKYYTPDSDYNYDFDSSNNVYNLKWKDYIEQIYNIESKKLTLNIHIPATIYNRIKLNPLVQIKNTVFLVASIEDWNEEAVTTKVNLVSIRALNKLLPNNTIPQDGLLLWDDTPSLNFPVNQVSFDDNNGVLIN